MQQVDVEKLQRLYRNRYGIELSQEEAEDLGTRLLSLLRVIYSPLSKEEFESIKKVNSSKRKAYVPLHKRG